MTMPFIHINDQELFYAYRTGIGDRTSSLLLIHGAGGSHLDWPAELRSIDRHDVYTLDLPGHGRSAPPGCSTIADYAEIVTSFIKAIAVQRIILVGHSMGGAIVQTIGLHPPPTVAGLVLLGSGARLRVAPAILEGIIPDFDNTTGLITDLAWSEDTPIELRQLAKRRLLESDPTSMYGDFLACNDFDLMDVVNEICLPTLVVTGSLDRLTPQKYSIFLAERMPDARLQVVEGAGHMVMLERPSEVAEAVLAFINDLV
jgi:pimeloyl-ACP methyl ester carboxylesterase